MDVDEFNRNQSLRNFPPAERWRSVAGVLPQPRSSGPALIKISGIDQTGKEVAFWTDLPNAMYLLRLLSVVQKTLGADVPLDQPPECGEFDGNL